MSPFGLKFSQMILHTETSKLMYNWPFLFVVLHKPTLLPSTFKAHFQGIIKGIGQWFSNSGPPSLSIRPARLCCLFLFLIIFMWQYETCLNLITFCVHTTVIKVMAVRFNWLSISGVARIFPVGGALGGGGALGFRRGAQRKRQAPQKKQKQNKSSPKNGPHIFRRNKLTSNHF